MTVKRCNKCGHSEIDPSGAVSCTQIDVAKRDPRFLAGDTNGTSASYERSIADGPCGRAGKLWEPREGKE